MHSPPYCPKSHASLEPFTVKTLYIPPSYASNQNKILGPSTDLCFSPTQYFLLHLPEPAHTSEKNSLRVPIPSVRLPPAHLQKQHLLGPLPLPLRLLTYSLLSYRFSIKTGESEELPAAQCFLWPYPPQQRRPPVPCRDNDETVASKLRAHLLETPHPNGDVPKGHFFACLRGLWGPGFFGRLVS